MVLGNRAPQNRKHVRYNGSYVVRLLVAIGWTLTRSTATFQCTNRVRARLRVLESVVSFLCMLVMLVVVWPRSSPCPFRRCLTGSVNLMTVWSTLLTQLVGVLAIPYGLV